MSAASFTPGPWAIEASDGGPLTGLDADIAEMQECEPFALADYSIVSTVEMTGAKRYNPASKVFDLPVPRTITRVVFDPRHEDADTERANARLLAAAPDLYEALEEILPRYVALLSELDSSPEQNSDVFNARAALAKANGEQP